MNACLEVATYISSLLRSAGGTYWLAGTEVQGESGPEVIALASHDDIKVALGLYAGKIPLKVFSVTEINELEVRQITKIGTLLFSTNITAVQEWERISEKLSSAPLDQEYAFDVWSRGLSVTFKPVSAKVKKYTPSKNARLEALIDDAYTWLGENKDTNAELKSIYEELDKIKRLDEDLPW